MERARVFRLYHAEFLHSNEPDGIIGNEDCGQMSAWYVMSALGFYQVSPGISVYTLGRPMVNKVFTHVKGGISKTDRGDQRIVPPINTLKKSS